MVTIDERVDMVSLLFLTSLLWTRELPLYVKLYILRFSFFKCKAAEPHVAHIGSPIGAFAYLFIYERRATLSNGGAFEFFVVNY